MSVKQIVRDILPMPVYRIVQFIYWHGYVPNIIFPKTFNEKLCRKMIFEKDPQMTLWADKFAVRDFVRERLDGDRHLNKIYASFTEPSAIWDIQLPERFVLKPNHASGLVYLHNGQEKPNLTHLENISKGWLSHNYYKRSKEWAYKNIKPRVLVEEFLGDGMQPPSDFKLFCFNGEVKVIQLDIDRYAYHKRNLYDRNWKIIPCEYGYSADKSKPVPRPNNCDRMIEVAEKLSVGTKFVRIDLYSVNDDVRFGEITNYPEGASKQFNPLSWDLKFGSMWPR